MHETFLGRWLRKRRARRHFFECEEAEVAAALTMCGALSEFKMHSCKRTDEHIEHRCGCGYTFPNTNPDSRNDG